MKREPRKPREMRKLGAREMALQALLAIEEEGAYSNLALNSVLTRYAPEPREAALTTEIVYGTIQRRNTIDAVLDRYIAKGIAKLQPWVRSLFRLSAYQLMYLDRIPSHAAVSEAVTIAKRRGHQGISGMVNAVLRKLAVSPGVPSLAEEAAPADRIAFLHSHPEWLVQRWIRMFGVEKTEEIAAANNKPPNISVRNNRLRGSREDLLTSLAGGIEAVPSAVSPDGIVVVSGSGNMAYTDWYADGSCTIQDESSMLVGAFLDPAPGMKVLDCCAAPGGKTTHLAELMENRGSILACDIHPHKRELIEQQANRLEISIIETLVADATKLHERFQAETFDCILLDAPCSGLGVIRRKPDIKWIKSEQDVQAIAEIQRMMLDSVQRLLKRGGVLVYSTCTLTEEENAGQVHAFLERHPQFMLAEIPAAIHRDVTAKCKTGNGMLTVLPSDFGTDGFFMARLRKE